MKILYREKTHPETFVWNIALDCFLQRQWCFQCSLQGKQSSLWLSGAARKLSAALSRPLFEARTGTGKREVLHARSSPAERAARLQFAQGGKGSRGHYPLFLEFGHPHFKALDAAQASPRVRTAFGWHRASLHGAILSQS